MRAVVVYESMYGNTHHVADAIGAGLSEGYDVSVVPVSDADLSVLSGADLVVVGGPTHMHGMSRPRSRQGAATAAGESDSGVTLEPDALALGLREWLESLGTAQYHGRAAAFDTRLAGPAAFTGRASKSVGKLLTRHGFELIAEPESFLVTKENHLVPDEGQRARDWGAGLAATATAGH